MENRGREKLLDCVYVHRRDFHFLFWKFCKRHQYHSSGWNSSQMKSTILRPMPFPLTSSFRAERWRRTCASARVSTITAPLGMTPPANISSDRGVQPQMFAFPSQQADQCLLGWWEHLFSFSLGEQDKSIGAACRGGRG